MYDFYKTPGVPRGPKYFSEVVEVPECLSSLYIFLYDFYKTTGVPEGHKQFSVICRSSKMSVKLVNIFLWLLEDSLSSWRSQNFSEDVEALECLSSLYMILYDFYKTAGVPGGP